MKYFFDLDCRLTRILLATAFHLVCIVSAEWEFQRLARSLHNKFRDGHSSKPLYSTRELHKRAEKCAQYYVRISTIDHSCPYVGNTGENIWAYWNGRHTDSAATIRSIRSWYEEEKYYRYRGNQKGTGHFTQLVWRNTKALGFGVARERNMVVAVGLYWPAGNYLGEYTKNVWKPEFRRRYTL